MNIENFINKVSQRVMIIGGAGFIGSNLVQCYLDSNRIPKLFVVVKNV